jgi:adenine deaminase
MLEAGHINKLIQRLNKEYDYFDILRSCTINPKEHYCLENGVLQPGDNADFVLSDSPDYSAITEVWIKGNRVFETKGIQFSYKADEPINLFNSEKLTEPAIQIKRRKGKMKVIKAFDGELLTEEVLVSPPSGEYVVSDVSEDILKIVVKDRYRNSRPAVGFINGFGLKKGAIASSVSHDSHNIICVGTNDSDIISCINAVTEMRGGLTAAAGKEIFSLPLPVAGIMSDRSCSETAAAYTQLNKVASELGSRLSAPFMTLSFMALLVIPRLKIGYSGPFDVEKFSFTDLFTS